MYRIVFNCSFTRSQLTTYWTASEGAFPAAPFQDTPKPRFAVGIIDDVTHLSLPVGDWLNVLPKGTTECMFYGLGSDGTVGANKSAVKMIAMGTELYAQVGFPNVLR